MCKSIDYDYLMLEWMYVMGWLYYEEDLNENFRCVVLWILGRGGRVVRVVLVFCCVWI